MADSDFSTPGWSSTYTTTVSRASERSAPRFNARATPFAQPFRVSAHDAPYSQFSTHSMSSQFQNTYPAPSGFQPQTPTPNDHDGSHQRPDYYFPPPSGRYPYQPAPPRPPGYFRSRPGGVPPDMNELPGVGDLFGPPIDHPMMRGVPGFSPPPYPQGYGTTPAAPFVQQQNYAVTSLHRPAPYPNGQNFVPAPVRESPERRRPFSGRNRRASQQESHRPNNRSNDHAERRAFRNLDILSRHEEGSLSPPSSMRRSFDRFSLDLPPSSTSSDAEEAAARVPPSSRARNVTMGHYRSYAHPQLYDPNNAISRQMQEFKNKLPRRLPNELPRQTSNTCDICAKDYSVVHVQPCEEDEVAIELPCGHCFGEFCIFQWVRVVSLVS